MTRQFNRRTVLAAAAAAGGWFTLPVRSARALANDELRLGFISCGSRARGHMKVFNDMSDVSIAALCDPDASRVAERSQLYPRAKKFADLRKLLDDPNIDAVVIATCNHWHCLAAIWAMQAGKDVYVEKPLSHSQWEGEQTVAAARKYNRICQVGTQQRSDPMQAEIKQFLHEERGLGKIVSCRVNRYGIRGPIGRRQQPLPIDSTVDYDLWLGPAQDEPIYRDRLQYDWHWDFNTGSGEMGNWGVHVLDDARNNVFRDQVILPKQVLAAGGRVAWDDAGETPNVHFAYFDTGEIPTVIGLSNLPERPGGEKSAPHPGPGSGYIAYCEGGRLEGQRGKAVAYDNQGQVMREFSGNSGNRLHQRNFIDCVRSRDASGLNADVDVGHASTGWCNLANIAFQSAGAFTEDAAAEMAERLPLWQSLYGEMREHLAAHEVDLKELRLSRLLQYNESKGAFQGEGAGQANRLLRREYRQPYEVPEIV